MAKNIGARAMVLGGTSGIGRATVSRLERYRASDYPTVVEEIIAYGQEHFDITDNGALDDAIQAFRPTHLVYSVGENILDWIQYIEKWTFDEIMKVNVFGFISTIQSLQRLRHPVSVVAVSSDAAYRPMRTSMVYCASKAALDMCIKVASRELAGSGWRVNGVAPGKVANTKMTEYVDRIVPELRGWTEDYARRYELQSVPIGRMVWPIEVAEVICDVLFGPDALTGAIVSVNGGR